MGVVDISQVQPDDIQTPPPTTPKLSASDWVKQNAPKSQVQPKPHLDKEVKQSSRHWGQTKEPPPFHKLPKDTKILGAPILPESGIIFTAAATALEKLDKAMGMGDPRILGGPVIPMPQGAPQRVAGEETSQ